MAITSVDLALAGFKPLEGFAKGVTGTMVAGRPHSTFYLAGFPGAATAPTPGVAGAALTAYSGQIPFPAASGNTHLGRWSMSSSAQGGVAMLCDRLWHNSGLDRTLTTAQTVNSVAWPARDKNGSTNGEGVYIGIEISTTMGTGTPTITMSYTNSDGVAGRTATNIDSVAASSIAGTFFRMGLQAGDKGVRSIQTITFSVSWGTAGVLHLVAYRELASIELPAAGLGNAVDPLTGGLARAYDNTVPFIVFRPQTTTTTQLSGSVIWTQG